jgi:hypothetical protein
MPSLSNFRLSFPPTPCPPRPLTCQLTAFEDVNKNFKVVIRVRPPLPRELTGEMGPFQNVVRVDPSERQIIFSENVAALEDDSVVTTPFATHTFTFDHVYDQNCNQRKVYETTAKAVVDSSLQGYNATIFAYGQTVGALPCAQYPAPCRCRCPFSSSPLSPLAWVMQPLYPLAHPVPRLLSSLLFARIVAWPPVSPCLAMPTHTHTHTPACIMPHHALHRTT